MPVHVSKQTPPQAPFTKTSKNPREINPCFDGPIKRKLTFYDTKILKNIQFPKKYDFDGIFLNDVIKRLYT